MGSCSVAAAQNDDEIAQAVYDHHGEPEPQFRPPLEGWSDNRADMADIKDLLKTLINVAGRTGELPQPVARPQTAMDRVKRSRVKKRFRELEAQLFPQS